jgi:Protein of unknown function (DUF2852)
MNSATNPQPYQNPAWGRQWNNQPWSGPSFWHPGGMGRPIAIALVVFLLAAGHIGRMLFWPIALAGLIFMVASGRFGCGRRRRWAQNQDQGNNAPGNNTWQSSPPWSGWAPWSNWCGGGGGNGGNQQKPPTSGNHAFDEYRAETLRRLEEEQSEFTSFLDRLRFAKDKAEFDQFMAERRQTPRPPTVPPMGPDESAHG